MSTQISLKLSDAMFESAKSYVDKKGFDSLQAFIRELMRKELYETEFVGGKYTSLASEASLAKTWNSKEEDAAWKHLQKEK